MEKPRNLMKFCEKRRIPPFSWILLNRGNLQIIAYRWSWTLRQFAICIAFDKQFRSV